MKYVVVIWMFIVCAFMGCVSISAPNDVEVDICISRKFSKQLKYFYVLRHLPKNGASPLLSQWLEKVKTANLVENDEQEDCLENPGFEPCWLLVSKNGGVENFIRMDDSGQFLVMQYKKAIKSTGGYLLSVLDEEELPCFTDYAFAKYVTDNIRAMEENQFQK